MVIRTTLPWRTPRRPRPRIAAQLCSGPRPGLRGSFGAKPCRYCRPVYWFARPSGFAEPEQYRAVSWRSTVPGYAVLRRGAGNTMGHFAKPCRLACPIDLAVLVDEVLQYLSLRSNYDRAKKALASLRLLLALNNSLTSHSRALTRSHSLVVTSSRAPISASCFCTQVLRVRGTQPILGAIDSMADQRDRYFPRCFCTMRTARSRTSGENLLNLLFKTPSSQKSESPQNMGRFAKSLANLLGSLRGVWCSCLFQLCDKPMAVCRWFFGEASTPIFDLPRQPRDIACVAG